MGISKIRNSTKNLGAYRSYYSRRSGCLSPSSRWNYIHDVDEQHNPKFLIEEQLAGAPFIRQAGVETLPMGYVVCAPGGRVGEVGKADLLEADQTERASAYAMTQNHTDSNFYLEAGSGQQLLSVKN